MTITSMMNRIVNFSNGSFISTFTSRRIWKGLFDTISGHEGGLNSVNMGEAGDTPGGSMSVIGKNLTDMTIAEVHANQHPNECRDFAVGKYQIIPKTMVGFIGYLKKKGINPKTTKFDARIQNMYGNYTPQLSVLVLGSLFLVKRLLKDTVITVIWKQHN